MKKRILLGAFLLLNLFPAFAKDTAKTFVIQDGAFPWYDRPSWVLADVPESLKGGSLPQQSCASRMLELIGGPTSVTVGVCERDARGFKSAFPNAAETGEKLSIKSANGATTLSYIVFKLANPPQKIQGNPPFAAGLVLLKVEGVEIFQSPAPEPANAPVEKTVPAQAAAVSAAPALEPAPVLPPREKFHLYLLMGQSNMVGRDTTGVDSQTPDQRVVFLDRANEWKVAREPMHSGGNGIGPGIPFALQMLERMQDKECKIGLIPCAVGGTPLKRWEKGADLYEKALKRAKAALQAGVLKGVLWHQGESDSMNPEDAQSYGKRLAQMLESLRQDLEAPDLPIVVGQLGEFVHLPQTNTVRDAIAQIPQQVPHVGFASSKDLNHKGDSLHFSADAEREFARRYAEAMQELQPKP